MLKKNIIVSFDSAQLKIMCNGSLLMNAPAAIVKKKSETPVAISFGDAAVAQKKYLKQNEMFVNPFKNGKIDDDSAAKLLIKGCFRTLFGMDKLFNIYVIVSGGLSDEDKHEIEKVFIQSGYSNTYLIDRPKIIAKLLEINGKNAALFADNDVTEFVIASNGKMLASYTTDISYAAFAENLREYFLQTNKIKLSVGTSLSLVKNYCSLFENDMTKLIAEGKDTITFTPKSIILTAKDIYPVTKEIYSKVIGLVAAALMDADKDTVTAVAQTGIILLGDGIHVSGLEEFIYKNLTLGCTTEDVGDDLVLSFASAIINDNKEWTETNAD